MSGEPSQSSVQVTEIEWNPVINAQEYRSDLIVALQGYPFNKTTALIKAISFINMTRATPAALGNKDARQQLYRIQDKCATLNASSEIYGGLVVSYIFLILQAKSHERPQKSHERPQKSHERPQKRHDRPQIIMFFSGFF